MARRTLHIPDEVEALVRSNARTGESFSAAACRLIYEGARRRGTRTAPAFIASGDGPEDLGRNAEYYLRHALDSR